MRLWLVAMLVACAAPDPARSYTFHTKWDFSPDQVWDATVDTVRRHHRIAVADAHRHEIVTSPEAVAGRENLSVSYVVRLNLLLAPVETNPHTTVFLGLNVTVVPVALAGHEVLPRSEIPHAARVHTDDLLAEIRARVYDDGLIH